LFIVNENGHVITVTVSIAPMMSANKNSGAETRYFLANVIDVDASDNMSFSLSIFMLASP